MTHVRVRTTERVKDKCLPAAAHPPEVVRTPMDGTSRGLLDEGWRQPASVAARG